MASVRLKLGVEWLVFENVPGLFSSYSGSAEAEREIRSRAERALRYGESIHAEEDSDFAAFLSAVRQCGYLGCWRVSDAQYFGVPQRRRRLSVLETGAVPRRFYLSPTACAGIIRRAARRGKELPPQLAHALRRVADSGRTSIATEDSSQEP